MRVVRYGERPTPQAYKQAEKQKPHANQRIQKFRSQFKSLFLRFSAIQGERFNSEKSNQSLARNWYQLRTFDLALSCQLVMSSVKKQAVKGTIWTVVGYGGSQALRLGSNLILTRLLVPDLFGLMALVNTFIMGVALFSDIGIRPVLFGVLGGTIPFFSIPPGHYKSSDPVGYGLGVRFLPGRCRSFITIPGCFGCSRFQL